MTTRNAFDGFDSDIGDGDASRWCGVLAKLALVVIVVGIVATVVGWTVVSAEFGAAVLAAMFAATAGLLVIRQAILAERQ